MWWSSCFIKCKRGLPFVCTHTLRQNIAALSNMGSTTDVMMKKRDEYFLGKKKISWPKIQSLN